MPTLGASITQSPHVFSEAEIQLQAVNTHDSLVFVINGQKAITLLNWVKSKEIQTWRVGSSTTKISGCLTEERMLILEYEVGVRSTIRGYKMKQTTSNCYSANAKYCRSDMKTIFGCQAGAKITTTKFGIDECVWSCPDRKYSFLSEVCLDCHANCKTCYGKFIKF